MFTGLVQRIGEIVETRRSGVGMGLCVRSAPLWPDFALGESVAVDGVCLTVTSFSDQNFWVDVSPETLDRTAWGTRGARGPVNIERALMLGDRLGGHLMLGHVDGVARIESIQQRGTFQDWIVEPPTNLLRYIAEKGSVCVDGVSLTVSALNQSKFGLALIPATLQATTLQHRKSGDLLNLEVDVIARYVERLMAIPAAPPTQEPAGPTLYDRLMENGFVR